MRGQRAWTIAAALLVGGCGGRKPIDDRTAGANGADAAAAGHGGGAGSGPGSGGAGVAGSGAAGGTQGTAGASGVAGSGMAGAPGSGGASGTAGAPGIAGRSGTAGAAGSAGGAAGTATTDAGLPPTDGPVPLPLTDAGVPVVSAPAQQACEKYAVELCSKVKLCRPATFSAAYGDDATCWQAYDRSCRFGLAYPGISDGPMRIINCAAAVQAQTCDQWNADRPPDACMAPPGMLTEGAPCNVTQQCQPGTFCRYDPLPPGTTPTSFRCGKCTRRVAEGQNCDGIAGDLCADGLVCLFTSAGPLGTCVRTLRVGDVCTGRDICEFPATCVNLSCQPIFTLKEGDTCRNIVARCDTRLDLYCNGLSGKCERRPLAAGPGQPCGQRFDGSGAFVDCGLSSTCSGVDSTGFVSVCVVRSDVGGPCTTAQIGPRCKAGLSCLMGMCVQPPPITPIICR